MTTYRDAGFLSAAFRNFLALLGWSAGEEQEIYSLDELVEIVSDLAPDLIATVCRGLGIEPAALTD